MKVISIIGARPQFIKAAPLSKALREAGQSEVILHTGQHYDHVMSSVFIDELGLHEPDYNLGVGSGSHGWQIAQMLMGVEDVLLQLQPDCVIVYGDTNSTLAGALAACKLRIPLAHVEAGLRSFNREMPEEHNRILTDHCSDLLFCPTEIAVQNLAKEGIRKGVHLVGDTMKDAILANLDSVESNSTIIEDLDLKEGAYYLATIHRPANTDEPDNLIKVLDALNGLDCEVVLPLHPRTRERIRSSDKFAAYEKKLSNVRFIEPVGYIDMLRLEKNARIILTDSGGIQKEAYILSVPCITLRDETEWVETLENGWNVLLNYHKENLQERIAAYNLPTSHPDLFGDGQASNKIVCQIDKFLSSQL